MPEDLPAPLLGAPPPLPSADRPPVPGWMWGLFGLGSAPISALLCAAGEFPHPSQMLAAGAGGAMGGLVLGVPLICGLALAGRFFHGTAGRIIGGVVFAGLLVLALAAVLFAGCMCIISSSK